MADIAHAKTPKAGQQTSPEADPMRVKKPKRKSRDAGEGSDGKDTNKKQAEDAKVGTPPTGTPKDTQRTPHKGTPKDGKAQASPHAPCSHSHSISTHARPHMKSCTRTKARMLTKARMRTRGREEACT